MFTLLTRSQDERDALIAFLGEKGISAVFHYVPLHASAMGRHFGYRDGQFPVSEDVSRRLVRLPLYTTMAEADQAEVIGALRAFADLPSVGT
jgi:dTDP-4-amino-4,6-dideoxygalactose transaminase